MSKEEKSTIHASGTLSVDATSYLKMIKPEVPELPLSEVP
jgi:hypothetical protein